MDRRRGGTLLGQYLALHDYRLWIALVIIALAGLYCEPMLPAGQGSEQLWRAFIPAALCGFWSLGDRAVLAAAWFPAVLWMLTILDRNEPQLAPDGEAAVLLGVLAVLFVAFLRARESRRVGLWRSVAAEPLVPIRPVELLREPPGRQLARAAWGLSVGAITIAVTVWLAPLRHLRRPFWDETIDQRVSNAWQLALIGLRDAGWRAGATEAPDQLARRAGVDGLDRCTAILERARHGIGLDADYLDGMHASADVAYRAARTGIGRFARVTGWLRWPLT